MHFLPWNRTKKQNVVSVHSTPRERERESRCLTCRDLVLSSSSRNGSSSTSTSTSGGSSSKYVILKG